MDININEVSYAHTGLILNYLVLTDSTIVRRDKKDKIYTDIKAHSNFIRISHSTYVNYNDIETITSIFVRMRCGKGFGYGGRYRKPAMEKYMKIFSENAWSDN